MDRNNDKSKKNQPGVALRKESVDRNWSFVALKGQAKRSLSARRAWIEISTYVIRLPRCQGRSPQGERG